MKLHLAELSRRGVFKTLAAYAVASWVIVEVTSVIAPAFLLPEWIVAAATTVMVLGAFPVVFLSWRYELSLEGIKRDTRQAPDEVDRSARRISALLIIFLLAITTSLWVNYFRTRSADVLDVMHEAQQGAPEISASGVISSIAVLPFDNYSADTSHKPLADSIAETVLHVLAQNKELVVTSRTSSFSFRDKDLTASEIGRLLNVETLLEGSVQIVKDRLRVTSQLIRTSDQTHIWSKVYEAPLDDLFQVQDAIAYEVRDLVLPQKKAAAGIAEHIHPPSIEAYQLLLEARALVGDPERNESAIRLLSVITGLWPAYSNAYAWLAMAWSEQWEILGAGHSSTRSEIEEAYELVLENARLALDYDPENSLAILVQGRATTAGTSENLHNAMLKVYQLAPNDPAVLQWLSSIAFYSANYKAAAEYQRRARAVEPGDFEVLENFLHYTCGEEQQVPIVESYIADYPVAQVKGMYLQWIARACDHQFVESLTTAVRLARLDSDPHSALFALMFLASLGHPEALEMVGQAHRLMPGEFNETPGGFVNPAYFPEILDERLATYQRHIQSMFSNRTGATQMNAIALIMAGDYEEAAKNLAMAKSTWDSFYQPEGGRFWQSDTMQIYALWSWLLARRGEQEEAYKLAAEMLDAMEQKGTVEWSGSRGNQADIPLMILLLNGEQELAVNWLLEAEQDQWLLFQPVLSSPVYAQFREIPEVAASLDRMVAWRNGLLEEVLATGLPEAQHPALLVDLMESLVTPTHHEQAQIALHFEDDLAGAFRHYEKALEQDPENIAIIQQVAGLARDYGLVDQAIGLYERIITLAPDDANGYYGLGLAYACGERYGDAVASMRKFIALQPGKPYAERFLGMTLLLDGEPHEAMDVFKNISDEWHRNMGLIMAYHALGQQEKSDTLFEEWLNRSAPDLPFHVAYVLAYRGDIDRAFKWLYKAATVGRMVDLAAVHPFLTNLHNDPRWLPFLESLGKSPDQIAAIEFTIEP